MVRAIVAMILLSGLVLTHELGHYAAMRAYGVPAEEVAIGFGPELADLGTLGDGAKFKINMIPLGGYVKSRRFNTLFAESPYGAIASAVVAVAGPLANILTVFVLLWLVVMIKVGWKRPLRAVPPALNWAFGMTFKLGLGLFWGLIRHPFRTIGKINGIVYILFGKNRMMRDIGRAIRSNSEMEMAPGDARIEDEFIEPKRQRDGTASHPGAAESAEADDSAKPAEQSKDPRDKVESGTLSGWGVACLMLASVAAFLGGFNLIPIAPLDGSRVVAAVLYWTVGTTALYWYGWIGLVLLGLLVLGVTINDIRCIVRERRKPKRRQPAKAEDTVRRAGADD